MLKITLILLIVYTIAYFIKRIFFSSDKEEEIEDEDNHFIC
jgi:hypothetical protein